MQGKPSRAPHPPLRRLHRRANSGSMVAVMHQYELAITLPDGESEKVLVEASSADEAVAQWWARRKAEVGGNATVTTVRRLKAKGTP